MEKSTLILKSIGTLAISSFALIAIPFISPAVESMEVESKSSLSQTFSPNNIAEIEMTPDDAEYIQKLRDHYYYDQYLKSQQ